MNQNDDFLKQCGYFPDTDHNDFVDVFKPKIDRFRYLKEMWAFLWPVLIQSVFCSAISELFFPHSAVGFILLILFTSALMHWAIMPKYNRWKFYRTRKDTRIGKIDPHGSIRKALDDFMVSRK